MPVGLPPSERKDTVQPAGDLNPALLSMLFMLVSKIASDNDEERGPEQVNTGWQPFVS